VTEWVLVISVPFPPGLDQRELPLGVLSLGSI